MKIKLLLFATLLSFISTNAETSTPRYVGGDISLLPDYEEAKAVYKDLLGNPIPDFLKFCYDEGMNCMRVRLFVDPASYNGPDFDKNAKQDLEYILPLCKRIKETGLALMLDFHYSDTWADPGKQWTPIAWQGLSDNELYQKIYDYTRSTLVTLVANGATPDFIQPGNEISYGMLWGPYGTASNKVYTSSSNGWERFGNLLKNAIKACREVCPKAGIIIHTERVAELAVTTGFYDRMKSLGIDYDIIGLSYYPYYHGTLATLDKVLTALEQRFPEKNIMIVETGYPYAWPVTENPESKEYDYTLQGQNEFAEALVSMLLKHPRVNGLMWWWMEYNGFSTSLSGWYNAPLVDSRDGKITPAFESIVKFGTGHDFDAVESVFLDNDLNSDKWTDLLGRPVSGKPLHGIYIHNGKTVLVR